MTDPFQLLLSFYHSLIFNVLLAICSTTYGVSVWVKPTKINIPYFIRDIYCPPTLTQASNTRCTTIRILRNKINNLDIF